MTMRLRKLIGTIVLVVFLAIYAIFAVALAGPILSGASKFVEMLYFIVAGLIWVVPAGVLISWMSRPDKTG